MKVDADLLSAFPKMENESGNSISSPRTADEKKQIPKLTLSNTVKHTVLLHDRPSPYNPDEKKLIPKILASNTVLLHDRPSTSSTAAQVPWMGRIKEEAASPRSNRMLVPKDEKPSAFLLPNTSTFPDDLNSSVDSSRATTYAETSLNLSATLDSKPTFPLIEQQDEKPSARMEVDQQSATDMSNEPILASLEFNIPTIKTEAEVASPSLELQPLQSTSALAAMTMVVPKEEPGASEATDTTPARGNQQSPSPHRKRGLLIDDQMILLGEDIKQNMADYSDTMASSLEIAPPTRRLMRLKENANNAEKLILQPDSRLKNPVLIEQYQQRLGMRSRTSYAVSGRKKGQKATKPHDSVEMIRRELKYLDIVEGDEENYDEMDENYSDEEEENYYVEEDLDNHLASADAASESGGAVNSRTTSPSASGAVTWNARRDIHRRDRSASARSRSASCGESEKQALTQREANAASNGRARRVIHRFTESRSPSSLADTQGSSSQSVTAHDSQRASRSRARGSTTRQHLAQPDGLAAFDSARSPSPMNVAVDADPHASRRRQSGPRRRAADNTASTSTRRSASCPSRSATPSRSRVAFADVDVSDKDGDLMVDSQPIAMRTRRLMALQDSNKRSRSDSRPARQSSQPSLTGQSKAAKNVGSAKQPQRRHPGFDQYPKNLHRAYNNLIIDFTRTNTRITEYTKTFMKVEMEYLEGSLKKNKVPTREQKELFTELSELVVQDDFRVPASAKCIDERTDSHGTLRFFDSTNSRKKADYEYLNGFLKDKSDPHLEKHRLEAGVCRIDCATVCDPVVGCLPSSCPCMKESALVGNRVDFKKVFIIYECSPSCPCKGRNDQVEESEWCPSIVRIRKGLKYDAVRYDRKMGFSIRAQQNMQRGEIAMLFAGEWTSQMKGEDKFWTLKIADGAEVDWREFTGIRRESLKFYVNPRKKGNLGRFICNSDDNNLSLIWVYRAGMRISDAETYFVVKNPVQKGDVLFFDYGDDFPMPGECLCKRLLCSKHPTYNKFVKLTPSQVTKLWTIRERSKLKKMAEEEQGDQR